MNGGLENLGTLCYLNSFLQLLRIVNAAGQFTLSSQLELLLASMDLNQVSDPVPFSMTLPIPFRPGYGQQDVFELMLSYLSSASASMQSSVAISVERCTLRSVCRETSTCVATDFFIFMTPLASTITQLLTLATSSSPTIGWSRMQKRRSDHR